ncbi:leucine-rich repeat domain-containing protein [Legionella fallonii]|uniref:Putative Leucine-rich repeat protein Substrate of the Dot/Icm secretion system n=1 Tax=Legionella fallonii LLAP-10 TaxID=1212491 RepID=A0A098G7J7_9GAMM|nr:hypothetical protein [Legionella fallonii]CEG57981.1 putative Leucine-rich repeat protein Substrate of the Dot/Icm secretion system [Legionella fallonii LLAP-10]
MKLNHFLDKVQHDDPFLATVKLSLKKKNNMKKLLAALDDANNLGCKNISELDLSGSRFTQEDFALLVQALNKLPNITTLRLDGCHITDRNTHNLVRLEHVNALSLKNNSLGSMPLFSMKLTALYLDNNPQLNVKIALSQFRTFPNSLKVLSLNQCNVTDSSLQYFISAGSKLKQLTQLHLRQNKLTSGCMATLNGLDSLTTLDLGNNFKIKMLGDALHLGCPSLEVLCIDHCDLNHLAFKSIAQMAKLHTVDLSDNSRLRQQFSLNKMDFSDTTHFANIRTMNLSACKLGDAFLSELIQFFPNLVHLNMASNQVSQAGVECLLKNLRLQVLDISAQELYKIPSRQKNPLTDKQKEAKRGRKKILDSLLSSICEADQLTEINLEGTGLSPKMLLSIIPTEKDQRKLTIINGLNYSKLEPILKKRITDKKKAKLASSEAKVSSSQELSSSAEMAVIELSPRKTSKKTEQIKHLQAEVKRLKQELEVAKATIVALAGGEDKTTKQTSSHVKRTAAIFEGLNTYGQFSSPPRRVKQGQQPDPIATSSCQR